MKGYSKPTILVEEEYSEGVYAASGCYTVTANIRQDSQTGRTDYRIQINAKHDANHTTDKQTLTVSFNLPVTYKNSNGTPRGATSGTTTLVIDLTYYQNSTDSIGMGDLVVEADQGLQITSIVITD